MSEAAAKSPSARRLAWLLGTALTFVLAGSLLVWWLIGREREDQRWVAHTEAVLRHLDALLTDVIDSETAERGFVISGEPSFLAPYEGARERLDRDLAELRRLTADNPAQQVRLRRAEHVARAELAAFKRVIDLRRDDLPAAMAAIAGAGDKVLTDQVRQVLAEMKREELALLARRQVTSTLANRRSVVATFAVLGLLLIALAASGWLVQRAAERRWLAEQRSQKLEAQLELARARRERDDFREQFLAVVGHDLRTPLGAIAIEAQLLDDLELRQERMDSGERILSATRRMTRMITQLLDLTRSRLGGGLPISLQRTNLNEVVSGVVDELARQYPERIRAQLPDQPLFLECDGDRIAQVVSNLLGNAIAHGRGVVEIRLCGRDESAELTVHNDGEPVGPNELATLLAPFRRGRGESAGLGLGLYISDQIVRGHGGSLHITSSAEHGTIATVGLPMTTATS